MAYFLINGKKIGKNKFWYHYRRIKDQHSFTFEFRIHVSDRNLISIISNYAKRDIFDSDLQNIILEKDKRNGSLGLFWYIFNYLNLEEENEFCWEYVINYIECIKIENEEIVITGTATEWRRDNK